MLPQLCDGDYFIVGDSAYPLTLQLVTPFRDNGRLSRDQRRYNTELSRKRLVIERAFASLKGRFRHLKFWKMWDISVMADKVCMITTCVLHNICLRGGDDGADKHDRE